MEEVQDTALFFFQQVEVLSPTKQPIFLESDILFPNEELGLSGLLEFNKKSDSLNSGQGGVNNQNSPMTLTNRSFAVPKRRVTLSSQSLPSLNQNGEGGGDLRLSTYMIKRNKIRKEYKKKKKGDVHERLIKKMNPLLRPTRLKKRHKKKKKKKKKKRRKMMRMDGFATPMKKMIQPEILSTPLRYQQMYLEEVRKTRVQSSTPSRILDTWLKVRKDKTPIQPRRRDMSAIPFPTGMKVFYGKQSVKVKSSRFREIDKRRIERKLTRKK